jgi:hypothetical protein
MRLTQPPLQLRAVEAADDGFTNARRFQRRRRFRSFARPASQFLSYELALSVELIGKTDSAELLFRIKTFDLFSEPDQ